VPPEAVCPPSLTTSPHLWLSKYMAPATYQDLYFLRAGICPLADSPIKSKNGSIIADSWGDRPHGQKVVEAMLPSCPTGILLHPYFETVK